MIYILTEDSKDGFVAIKNIVTSLYDKYIDHIKVETFNGIINANKVVSEILKNANKTDTIIIVFDEILENIIVRSRILELLKIANNDDRVKLIGTKLFEVEVMLIDNIEFIGDKEEYNRYFKPIKQVLNNNNMEIEKATQFIKHNLL